MGTAFRYDVRKMRQDLAERGWLPRDLARAAGVSDMTVSRFLNSTRANPRTADRLARALGFTARRYLIRNGRDARVA
jgi:plasmid maintenance system antidote protein VapI